MHPLSLQKIRDIAIATDDKIFRVEKNYKMVILMDLEKIKNEYMESPPPTLPFNVQYIHVYNKTQSSLETVAYYYWQVVSCSAMRTQQAANPCSNPTYLMTAANNFTTQNDFPVQNVSHNDKPIHCHHLKHGGSMHVNIPSRQHISRNKCRHAHSVSGSYCSGGHERSPTDALLLDHL